MASELEKAMGITHRSRELTPEERERERKERMNDALRNVLAVTSVIGAQATTMELERRAAQQQVADQEFEFQEQQREQARRQAAEREREEADRQRQEQQRRFDEAYNAKRLELQQRQERLLAEQEQLMRAQRLEFARNKMLQTHTIRPHFQQADHTGLWSDDEKERSEWVDRILEM